MGAGVSVEGCTALPLEENDAKERFANKLGELEASLIHNSCWTRDERVSLRQALEAGRGYYEGLITRAHTQRSNLEEMRAKLMTPFLNVYRETFKSFIGNDPSLKDFLVMANEFASEVNNVSPRQSTDDVVTIYEDGASRMRSQFETLVQKTPAGKGTIAPLKHLGRTLEKMMLKWNEEERFKADNVLDVLRGMIECDNMTDMLIALLYLCQDSSHGWRVVRIKNRFEPGGATSGGWVDCLLNVVYDSDDSSHVCEIQLVHEKMMVLRKRLGGHNEYYKFRTADEFIAVIDGGHGDNDVTKSEALLKLEDEYNEAKAQPKKDFSLLKVLKKKIEEQKRLDGQVARLKAKKEALLAKQGEATDEEQWEIAESLQEEIIEVETAIAEAEARSTPKPVQRQNTIKAKRRNSSEVKRVQATQVPVLHEEEEDDDDEEEEDDEEADEQWKNPVVIDNGSWKVKAGLAGDDAPSVVLSSIVGYPKMAAKMVSKTPLPALGEKDACVGDEAQTNCDVLKISCPIDHGIVTNWDDMEKIWHHVFYNELRCAPDEHPVLLSETPLNPKANRERTISLLFETFRSPAVYLAVSAILSLYSTGRTTGCVVSSGAEVTHVAPVYEGYIIPFAVRRLDIAGNAVTDSLKKMLEERGSSSFTTFSELEIIRDIKEKLGFVAPDYEKAMEDGADEREYELADGGVVVLGNELFRCAEAIFTPSVIGSESKGLPETLVGSVIACDVDVRRELYKSIVLDGGGTMLTGFDVRLRSELESRMPDSMEIGIVLSPERMYGAWTGGSILASLTTFGQMWITKDEYDEDGPGIVHRKCT